MDKELEMIQERRNYQPLVTRPEQRSAISLCESCLVAVVKFIGARCARCQRKHDAFMRNLGWVCWVVAIVGAVYFAVRLAFK